MRTPGTYMRLSGSTGYGSVFETCCHRSPNFDIWKSCNYSQPSVDVRKTLTEDWLYSWSSSRYQNLTTYGKRSQTHSRDLCSRKGALSYNTSMPLVSKLTIIRRSGWCPLVRICATDFFSLNLINFRAFARKLTKICEKKARLHKLSRECEKISENVSRAHPDERSRDATMDCALNKIIFIDLVKAHKIMFCWR